MIGVSPDAAALQRRDDGGIGRDDPALELVGREASRPAVEQLHRFRARLDLAREVGRSVSPTIASRIAPERCTGIAIGERAGIVLGRGCPAPAIM